MSKKVTPFFISVLFLGICFFSNQTKVIAATQGTEKSPYQLTLGTSKKINSNNCWFCFTSKGEIDLNIKCTKNSTIKIYKKTMFGKSILNTKIGNSFSLKYSLPAKQTYIVNIVNNTKYLTRKGYHPPLQSITCTASLHTDVKYSKSGGIWQPNSKSAYPGNPKYNIIYLKRFYIPKSEAQKVYDAISSDKYLTVMDEICNTSLITAETILATKWGIQGVAANIIFNVATSKLSVSFRKDAQASMRKAGNYSNGRWRNGVCIDVYLTPKGAQCYSFSPWNPTKMSGASGYRGTWKK